MKPETVEKWTHTIDTFKIIPRALILMWMYLTYSVIFWFMSLDLPTLEQTSLVSVVTGAQAAAFGLFLGHSKAS
tara:strand:- start:370 stop:591 length:222 start_codon:yes stop_codon:yes gene_type:complete